MQQLTCPIPSNINPLQSNGFQFTVVKMPDIGFFCQEINLPQLSLGTAQMETPLVMAPIPGEKLDFGELSITFMIDEDMINYISVHAWMVGLGFPALHKQYTDFITQRTNALFSSELMAGYSDGILQILNNQNNPIRTIRFVDMFPTSLQSLQLQSTVTDTNYLAGVATFAYTYYAFE